MRALDVTTFGYAENLRAKQLMAGVSTRFSFATATTIQRLKNNFNHENAVKSTAFWVFDLEKVVFREGTCKGNRK